MKSTQSAAPAVQFIDGKPYVRVVDLAHQWDTTTSNILASCKDHHVPEEQLRRIDGRVWCGFAGLRYRLTATKTTSRLTRHIREFLESQDEKPTATEPEPTTSEPQPTEPAATDLGIASLIAAARRDASQALAKAEEAANIAEKASEHVDHVEKDAIAHRCDALGRVRQAEHNQRDAAARIGTLEEHARVVDWTLAAVALLGVVGHVMISLLRRR